NAAAQSRPTLVPALFFVATRDSKTGMIYLKVVNGGSAAQPLHVQISGANKIGPTAEAVTLSASSPDDTNSINDPTKIVPVTTIIDGVAADFTHEFPPFSITVLRIKAN
ncbi:MAG TPA: alpha-L-arabinofuranosidase C-terminal domain-containing protein, partial [Verrucomicrobiae bacterium]|nr:alpha-L-arabinofuranosidase C-terminal domain-containing protein [Verrucomicrobiae bacterium]